MVRKLTTAEFNQLTKGDKVLYIYGAGTSRMTAIAYVQAPPTRFGAVRIRIDRILTQGSRTSFKVESNTLARRKDLYRSHES